MANLHRADSDDSFQDWLVTHLDFSREDIAAVRNCKYFNGFRHVHGAIPTGQQHSSAATIAALAQQASTPSPMVWPCAVTSAFSHSMMQSQSVPVPQLSVRPFQHTQQITTETQPAPMQCVGSMFEANAPEPKPKPKRYSSLAQKEAHKRYRERRKHSVSLRRLWCSYCDNAVMYMLLVADMGSLLTFCSSSFELSCLNCRFLQCNKRSAKSFSY